MHANAYTELIDKLDRFIRKYYKNQLIKGSLYCIGLVVGFYLFVALAEHFGNFGRGLRMGLFYGLILGVAGVFARFVAIPLFKLMKLGKTISHEEAAKILGNHFPEVSDKLINVLQLKEMAGDSSSALLQASIEQKTVELQPVPFQSAINLAENRKYLRYALPPVMALIIILFSAPSLLTDSTNRLVKHNEEFIPEAPFTFTIENENLEGVRQSDFDLKVKLEGEEIPNQVFIEIDNNRFKLQKSSLLSFEHTFRNIQETQSFRLYADEFYSDQYELKVLPNPVILNFEVELDYPQYVNKSDAVLKNTGDLMIPEGTKVKWNFKTQDTERITMAFPDSSYELSRSTADDHNLSLRLFKGGSYFIHTENAFLKSDDSIQYGINIVPDIYPSIDVDERADSLNSKRIYFRGIIKDDYGFDRLVFHYTYLNKELASEDGRMLESTNQTAVSINRKSTQDQFFHVWDLNELGIQAGDEIEYYFEIWDNDAVNGSKATRSSAKLFKAPTMKELSEQQDESNEEIKEDLTESIQSAQQLQREMKKMRQKLVDKKKLSWEDKKQITELLEEQKRLEQKLDQTKQKNLQKMQQQSEYRQVDEKIMEKQQKLQEMFEKIMTEEMRQMYEEMEELMEKMDKNKMQEMLEDMEFNEKDLEKELDRTLEIFKQMEFEQKLQENIDKLNELAEKQEELSEKSKDKDADSEELQKEQEELNKEFDDLKKEMDDMEQKNEDLEFPNEMPSTEEQEKSIEEEMNKSSDQLSKDQKKKASDSQKNASDQMKKMSEQMEQMQQQMQQEGYEEDLDAMRQLFENLVQLSFDQEDVMINLKGLNKNDPKYVTLGQKQKKLKDDAKMIEDSLFALSKRIIEIESIVNREISAVNQNMEKGIELMTERKTPLVSNRQQLVMTSVNNLALLFDEIIQQMQAQMSSEQFGEKSCSKPGSSGKPSAGSLKKMQQQLKKQLEQMKKEMGKSPGQGKPGGQGKMSESLAKMAAQQEAIRNELRKMAEQMSDEEGEGGGKGRLEEISKMMEETEVDLVNRRITQQTLKRQEEIMTRLLESEKAEREREMDNKRESKEAKNEDFGNPDGFFEYNRLKQKEVELLKTIPPALNSFYKQRVNEYFNTFD